MIACKKSRHSITEDFPEVSKIVEAGATTKPINDYELPRIKNANMDGYAGDVGVPIDRVQMWLE